MEAHSLPHRGGLPLPKSGRLLATFSDERLVSQVRRGNEHAFEAIFDRHHRQLLSFCRHMLGSADEAEDAVQQTFASAYDAMRGDARELKLKAWLYAIARNKCLSILRARREHPSELDDVPTAGLAEEVQQRADLRELLNDMRELPEEQRAALVLSELGDLSHADIGAIVGCEPVKVKALVFQARSSLIENRNARETPCTEIREQLATARGGVLRRGPLRKHLKACAGCRQFRDDVARQRAMVALVLPVFPSAALKSGVLSGIGLGGGGAGGLAAGGTAAGAGAGMAASAGGVKLATAIVATIAAVGGGGVAVSEVATDDENSPRANSAGASLPAQAGAKGPRSGPAAVLPLSAREAREERDARAERRAERKAEVRAERQERKAAREKKARAEREAPERRSARTREERTSKPPNSKPPRSTEDTPDKQANRGRGGRPPATVSPPVVDEVTEPVPEVDDRTAPELAVPEVP